MLSIRRPQDRPATGRQNARRLLRQSVNDFLLNVAKPRFAFTLKKLTDRAPQTGLYRVIRVNKGKLQPPRELPSNRGFS